MIQVFRKQTIKEKKENEITAIGTVFHSLTFPVNNKMHNILSGHNHSILIPKQKSIGCNCRKKDSCPLNGECLAPKVIHRPDVWNEANQKFYFGSADTTFKERYNNHKRDVKHIKYQYNTELTKYIWNLKNYNIKYNTQW